MTNFAIVLTKKAVETGWFVFSRYLVIFLAITSSLGILFKYLNSNKDICIDKNKIKARKRNTIGVLMLNLCTLILIYSDTKRVLYSMFPALSIVSFINEIFINQQYKKIDNQHLVYFLTANLIIGGMIYEIINTGTNNNYVLVLFSIIEALMSISLSLSTQNFAENEKDTSTIFVEYTTTFTIFMSILFLATCFYTCRRMSAKSMSFVNLS